MPDRRSQKVEFFPLQASEIENAAPQVVKTHSKGRAS